MSEIKSEAEHDGATGGAPTRTSSTWVTDREGLPSSASIRVPTPRELGLHTSYGPIRALATCFKGVQERKLSEILDAASSANVSNKAIRTLIALRVLHKNGYLRVTDFGQKYIESLGGPEELHLFREALNSHAPFRHLYRLLGEKFAFEGFGARQAADVWTAQLSLQGDGVSAKATVRGTMLVFLNLARESGVLLREQAGAPYRFPGAGPTASPPSTLRPTLQTFRFKSRIVPDPYNGPPTLNVKLQATLKQIVRASIHSKDPQLKKWAVEILDAMGEQPPW